MWLLTNCSLKFDIVTPTPFVLMLRPRSGEHQWIGFEEYKIVPSVPVFEFTDIYGNLCQRLTAPVGNFSIQTTTKIMTADTIEEDFDAPFVKIQDLPQSTLVYLLPSRYCEADHFSNMATEITAGELWGYNQVVAIVKWMQKNISFEPTISNRLVSAIEVNIRGYGVCRDFSHLGIALCRSLSIPARMVVGYLHDLEPMDLHAWFEAYVGDRWYLFDATQSEIKGGYVAIGYGRDAADVAIYNQFGPSLYPSSQSVNVEKIEND